MTQVSDEAFPIPPPPQTRRDDLRVTAARRPIDPGGRLPSSPLCVFPAVATLVWLGLAYLREHPIHDDDIPGPAMERPQAFLCSSHAECNIRPCVHFTPDQTSLRIQRTAGTGELHSDSQWYSSRHLHWLRRRPYPRTLASHSPNVVSTETPP